MRAAKLLEDDDVEIRIIGTGQEEQRVAAMIRDLQPRGLHRIDFVPLEQLADEIAAATLCLGIFGASAKAARVVPNKVFECVAVGRPVVTADTEGVRAFFDDDEIAMVRGGRSGCTGDGDPASARRSGAARAHGPGRARAGISPSTRTNASPRPSTRSSWRRWRRLVVDPLGADRPFGRSPPRPRPATRPAGPAAVAARPAPRTGLPSRPIRAVGRRSRRR